MKMAEQEFNIVYTMEKSRYLASSVISHFTPEDIKIAVRDAMEEQVEREKAGLVQILIPCKIKRFTPPIFLELLEYPELVKTKYIIEIGEETFGDKKIYGRKSDAYHGTVVSGRNHNGFLVNDSTLKILPDMINREGKTLMNLMLRDIYLSELQEEVGHSVAWQESPLIE